MDDLLDLDLTSANSSSNTTANSRSTQTGYGAGKTTFDYLSSMGSQSTSSSVSSRTGSPFAAGSTTTGPPRPLSATSGAKPGTVNPPRSTFSSGNGSDAFSSLFDASPASTKATNANGASMSMAERLSSNKQGQIGASSTSLSANNKASQIESSDPWDFDMLANKPTSSSIKAPRAVADPVEASGIRLERTVLDDDDDDPFDMGSSLLGSASSKPPQQTSNFSHDDDFDLLGAFSQPVTQQGPEARKSAPESRSSHSSGPASSPSSLPPHVVGQIVEMGFSIDQAQTALAATRSSDGSWDAQAALEILMDQADADGVPSRKREAEERDRKTAQRLQDEENRVRDGNRPRLNAFRDPSDDEQEREDPVLRRKPEGAERRRPLQNGDFASTEDGTARVQEQANELLAQASKFGLSMFKSGKAYWESGKAQIQKAIDEAHQGTSQDGSERPRGKERVQANGKPKWKTEGMADLASDRPSASERAQRQRPAGSFTRRDSPATEFRDSDDEDQDRGSESQHRYSRPQAAPPVTADLLQSTQPTANADSGSYKSPWRRAKAVSPTASASEAPRRRTPTPPRRPARKHVAVSTTQLRTAMSHKEKGNELFKLGRFGDADATYSEAIAALPAGTIVLVPLYNNRAAARLRNGEERRAAEDCTEVLTLILGSNSADSSTLVSRLEVSALQAETLPAEAKDVNLVEQLGKALSKRAKAHEATEKWSKAGDDWAAILQGGDVLLKAAGGVKLVNEGAARCRKMTGGADTGPAGPRFPGIATRATLPARTTPPPRPRSAASGAPAAPPTVITTGDAARALRAANAAAEAEDDLKLKLKDGVDAKIIAWKGGKESNLRALISSLDNVLWPALGWKTVGMNQLLTEGQLKVQYVRAIAKLHPDKLNASNTTVEQRMIAAQVFGALNDAWNSMKS
ncbi:auxilin-like clathrin-binding protein required for normal clathrin function [Microbotryomycetes sp. JL221]|nr:auxilin-like clathrin-binding protein required for normal clathrin function [Microbotryomycetes sp. JL221]